MKEISSTSLLFLVRILDAGSISEAARRLKMTRANVSYHLKALEAEAGVELVRRTTRRIEPTDLALRLYEHGVVIRRALDAAREAADDSGDTPTGRVRVSVPNAYGEIVVAKHLLDFKIAYPTIALEVVFENRITDLIRDEIDIAVRPLSDPPPNLDVWNLGPLRIRACANQHFAEHHAPIVHPEDLARAPVITATVLDRRLRVAARRGNVRHEVFVEPTLSSHNFTFLRLGVLRGAGVGLMSDFIVENDIAEGTLVEYLDEWEMSMFGRRMYMLAMPSTHRPPAIALALDFLCDVLGAVRRHRTEPDEAPDAQL